MGRYTGRLQFLWRVASLNLTRESSARGERTGHGCPYRTAGCDDVLKDTVHRVLIENAQIPVRVDVHFEGLEFKALLVRHVVERDGAEVRQIRFRANRRVLRNLDRNFISLILIRESFDVWKGCVNAAFGMPLVVAQSCCPSFPVQPFAFHPFTSHCSYNCFIQSV